MVFCEVAPAHNYGEENAALEAHLLVANASHLNIPSLTLRFFKSYSGDTGADDEPTLPGCW